MAYSEEYLSSLWGMDSTVLVDDCTFLDEESSTEEQEEAGELFQANDMDFTMRNDDRSTTESDNQAYSDVDSTTSSSEESENETDFPVECLSDNSQVRTKYPIHSCSSLLIISAALMVLVVEKNISAVAFDSLMSLLMATGLVHQQAKLTWRSMKRLLQKSLFFEDVPYVLEESKQVAVFNLLHQIRLILVEHYDTIISYRTKLSSGNGDILCAAEDIDCRDPLVLHLHLSADGGQLYRYKKQSLWAVHATVLDLPLYLRSKKENMILLYLCASTKKPDWSHFLKHCLKNSLIGKTVHFDRCGVSASAKIILYSAVFDLPAMASILNHVQFNGKFGCLYCLAPGYVKKVGKGHSRKYRGICELVSDEKFYEICSAALESNSTVFGVKGFSCLTEFLPLPSRILLDPLHLLFENCGKLLILKLIDTSSYRDTYYLGRHIDHWDSICKRLLLPHFIAPPRSTKDLSFWKARDIMNFIFFFSIPSVYMSLYKKPHLSKEYGFHFLTFVTASHLCYSPFARSFADKVQILFTYFHSRLSSLYGPDICTLNMHLLLHLSKQIKQFGALPFCSMFSFEHQFSIFKLVTQGTRCHVQQICEKLSLLKYSKCFLSVTEYERKHDVVKIIPTLAVETTETVVEQGRVMLGNLCYYSKSYSPKSDRLSTIYQISPMFNSSFVDVLEFRSLSSSRIIALVNLFKTCSRLPMFNFDFDLPDVPIPEEVKDIMNDEVYYYFVEPAGVRKEIPFEKLLHPCIMLENIFPDVDSSISLVVPCNAVHECN